MKTKLSNRVRLCTLLSALAAVFHAAARILISGEYLESGVELYAQGAVLPTVWTVVTAASVVIFAVCGILTGGTVKKEEQLRLSAPSAIRTFVCVFTGFILLAYDAVLIFDMSHNGWREVAPLIGSEAEGVTMASAVFTFLFLIAAIPAATYFFAAANTDPDRVSAGFGILSAMPVIWFVLCVLHIYFDQRTAHNSPVKNLHLIAILVLMLYAVHESRCLLRIAQPRIYFACGYAGVFMGLTTVLSDAVLYAQRKIGMDEGYIAIAVMLAYVVYMMTGLFGAAVRTGSAELPEQDDPAEKTDEG